MKSPFLIKRKKACNLIHSSQFFDHIQTFYAIFRSLNDNQKRYSLIPLNFKMSLKKQTIFSLNSNEFDYFVYGVIMYY